MYHMVDEEKKLIAAPVYSERASYKNFFWALGGVLAFTIAGYAFLFSSIESKASRIGGITSTLEQEVEKNEEFQTLRSVIATTEETRAELDDYFVFSDEVVPTIERIESFGKHAGVAVVFDGVNVKEGEGPTLELQLRAGGSFESLFYFLSLVQSLPLRLSFERVFVEKKQKEFARPKDVAGEWNGTFAFSITSFVNEERAQNEE